MRRFKSVAFQDRHHKCLVADRAALHERAGRGAADRRASAAIAASFLLLGASALASGAGQADEQTPSASQPAAPQGEANPPRSAQQEQDDAQLEEVVVTGSLIKRTEASSNMVTPITADEIEKRGATNATEILSAIAQNQPLEVPNSFTGAGTALASYASLRSLGSESTLVLFGGRRIVNNPYQNRAVDLNTVPVALIDRVDVLSDGASSIYGSDAIAGVINFITRDEFKGLQVSGNTFQPQEPGGQAVTGSATVGFGSLAEDHWNFYAGGQYRKRKIIKALDRDFGDSAYFPEAGVDRTQFDTFPMNVSQFEDDGETPILDSINPFFPECDPPRSLPLQGTCKNDNSAEVAVQNPEEQWSAITRLSGRFGEHTASLEYFYAESTVVSAISSNQLDGMLQPDNPFFPGNGVTPAIAGLDPTREIEAFGRFPAAGPRSTDSNTYTDRVLGELKGDMLGFDYELWALQSKAKVRLRATGRGILFTQGVDDAYTGANGAPFINPFGDQTDEFMDYLQTIQYEGPLQTATGELRMAGLQVSKGLFQLPAGTVAAALGFEYGEDKVGFDTADAVEQGLIQGFSAPGQDTKAERNRNSVTAEVLIPVFERLELDGSVRRDHYDDFGNTVNPKILATYKVIDNVLNVHASYNTGFRAPTLYELFAPRDFGFTPARHDDPVLCPNGDADESQGGLQTRDCAAIMTTLDGANPDLDPIESDAYAVGFDWTPMPGLSFGVDYWDYKVHKIVGELSDETIFGDLDRFGSFIVRCLESEPALRGDDIGCDSDGSPQTGGGNPIAYILHNKTNLGNTKTNGFDFGMNWAKDFAIGTLALDYRGTYINKYDFQEIPGDPAIAKAGAYFDAPLVRYSHYTSLSWDRGAWGAQLQNRLSSGYVDFNNGNGRDRSYEFYHVVRPYSLWNFSASYKHGDTWTVTALVKNLFNTDPPFTNKTQGLATGYDERQADPIGRAFGLTISANFSGFGGSL